MTTRLSVLAVPFVAVCLITAAFAQGGAPSQPTDPTAQSPAAPQTTPPTFPAPEAKPEAEPTPTAEAAAAPPEGVQTFSGSIARQHGAYVLKAGNAAFKLDDQSKARDYKGKNVTVTGSLDKNTQTIHVQKIEASSSM